MPECGKTTALTLLKSLVRRPILASNVSTAVIFRAIERWQPTLLIDEADTYLHDNEGMAGVLNSGHRRGAACVLRVDGPDFHPAQFSTWAPLAIAKIGKLSATLVSRSIVIMMRRALPGEVTERLGSDQSAELTALARQAARWVADTCGQLRSADPAMPPRFGNRLADNWRPLIAIADQAGGAWPKTARETALLLSGREDDMPPPVQLLADIRRVFAEHRTGRLSSEDLAKGVNRSPPKVLAHQLKPFGIRPAVIRMGDKTPRGYRLSDFEDAFARYLPPQSATTQHPNAINELSADAAATRSKAVADGGGSNPLKNKAGCGVADRRGSRTKRRKASATNSEPRQ